MQVKSQLKEKLNELPTQEELQKKADNFIAQLPNYKVNYHKILVTKIFRGRRRIVSPSS